MYRVGSRARNAAVICLLTAAITPEEEFLYDGLRRMGMETLMQALAEKLYAERAKEKYNLPE